MRLLVVLSTALLMLAACSTSDSIDHRKPGQIIICHHGKSIAVSNADMFVHESHGDTMAPCPEKGSDQPPAKQP